MPVGEVKTVREALSDPHTQARHMVRELHHPSEGAFPALGLPLRLNGSDPAGVAAAPPLLGADTDDVLREKLGLGPEAISALRGEGVIG